MKGTKNKLFYVALASSLSTTSPFNKLFIANHDKIAYFIGFLSKLAFCDPKQGCWKLKGSTSLNVSILITKSFYCIIDCSEIIFFKIYVPEFLDALALKVSPFYYSFNHISNKEVMHYLYRSLMLWFRVIKHEISDQ